jgi:4-hydroxybenzoate polyprenyltransferase
MIRLARPEHWVKNVVVLMPIAFGLRIQEGQAWIQVFTAAIVLCLLSSFGYILNDIKDCEGDRAHPKKRTRPLASGEMSIAAAIVEAIILLALAIVLVTTLPFLAIPVILIFVLLQICYTLFLKRIVLVDVICIALGFVLRTATGAVAIKVAVSPWLFICTFTICLFMGFCKRYSEVVTITDTAQAENHRPTLIHYTPELLTHLITVSAGIAVITFLFYGLHERTVEQFGTNYFIYTLPLVVYAVFRFAMLSMSGTYMDPTDLILHDRPFQVIIFLWGLAMLSVIYWGRDLAHWIDNIY